VALMCVRCHKRPAVGARDFCTVCQRAPRRSFKAWEKQPNPEHVDYLSIAERLMYPGLPYPKMTPRQWWRCVAVARTLANIPYERAADALDAEQIAAIAKFLTEREDRDRNPKSTARLAR